MNYFEKNIMERPLYMNRNDLSGTTSKVSGEQRRYIQPELVHNVLKSQQNLRRCQTPLFLEDRGCFSRTRSDNMMPIYADQVSAISTSNISGYPVHTRYSSSELTSRLTKEREANSREVPYHKSHSLPVVNAAGVYKNTVSFPPKDIMSAPHQGKKLPVTPNFSGRDVYSSVTEDLGALQLVESDTNSVESQRESGYQSGGEGSIIDGATAFVAGERTSGVIGRTKRTELLVKVESDFVRRNAYREDRVPDRPKQSVHSVQPWPSVDSVQQWPSDERLLTPAELSQEYFLRGEAEMEIYEQLLSQVERAGDGTAPSRQSAGGELRKQNAHNCLQAAVLHINYAIDYFKEAVNVVGTTTDTLIRLRTKYNTAQLRRRRLLKRYATILDPAQTCSVGQRSSGETSNRTRPDIPQQRGPNEEDLARAKSGRCSRNDVRCNEYYSGKADRRWDGRASADNTVSKLYATRVPVPELQPYDRSRGMSCARLYSNSDSHASQTCIESSQGELRIRTVDDVKFIPDAHESFYDYRSEDRSVDASARSAQLYGTLPKKNRRTEKLQPNHNQDTGAGYRDCAVNEYPSDDSGRYNLVSLV